MAFIDLLTRIGFSVAQANAIIEEGITDPEDLVTYTHSDIKTLFKHLANRQVHPPFGSQHKFQILRYWVEKRSPLGLDCAWCIQERYQVADLEGAVPQLHGD